MKNSMNNFMNNFEYAQVIEMIARKEILSDLSSDDQKEFAQKIFDEFLIIEPRKEDSNIVTISFITYDPEGKKGISRKLSNVRLNLKEVVLLALETSINFKLPSSAIDYIRIALNILLKVYALSAITIENSDCQLLVYLHSKNAYENPIKEEQIISDIESGALNVSKDEYYSSVAKLVKIASVSIVNGKVWLKEKIKLKYSLL